MPQSPQSPITEALSDSIDPIAIGPVWQRDENGKWLLPEHTLGWEILGWTAKYLRQPDGPAAGQPWRYTPEQARLILWWYALDEAGRFAYRYGVMRRPKGHGKDPFAASVALVELVGPCRFDGWRDDGTPRAKPHPAAWVQVAAVNQEQTRNTMTLFPSMISDELKEAFDLDLGKTIIYARQGRARLEAVTSSPRALEGGRATFVIMNETHHWLKANDGHQMAAVVARNAGKSRDASSRALAITNAHLPGENSIGEQDWDAYEKEAAGEIEPTGRLYDSIEARDGLDPRNPEHVAIGIRDARGDSNWAPLDRVVQEFLDPRISVAEAQRFYWNRISGSDANWIDLADWRACKDTAITVEQGERICLGFDGSLRNDSTALVACRLSDGHIWPVRVWEKPDGPLGNSWQVPREEVDGVVDRMMREYDVYYLYADPPHWQDYVDKWAATYGEKTVIEFHTNSPARMARALERLHTSILARELTHDGDETLTRHVGNAMGVERAGGMQVNKRKKTDKIDALVAATLAYEARNDAVADGALVNPVVAYINWDEL
jgi:hypothetical protein